jgi:hypothetical protein
MNNKMTKRGGFIPAAALAGLVGRAAVGWAVPKALNYMSKKKKGKGHKKGHGVVVPGSRGGALYLHGSMPSARKKGRALFMPGAKPGRGIKEMAQKAMKNPMIKQMVDRAKSQVKRHINYALDNPEQAYKNVKRMITGGEGMKRKSVGKAMRTLSVKQRRLPKQKVGIESSQQGGTTAITISKHFKPNAAMPQPMTFKEIKNKI